MSNWNQVEERLRSWTPRAPSRSVSARLFAVSGSTSRVPPWNPAPESRNWEPSTAGYRAVRPAAWHWLAPAMAVFLLGIFVFGRPQAGLDGGFGMAWAVTPQERIQQAACSSTTHHSEANSPPVTMIESTFEWTSEGPSLEAPAPMGQTPVGQTNSPMQ